MCVCVCACVRACARKQECEQVVADTLLKKRIINKDINHSETAETEHVHLSDVTNPAMFSDPEPAWRLGRGIIELRYMADQFVCADYDSS